jgi:hypothetical protein
MPTDLPFPQISHLKDKGSTSFWLITKLLYQMMKAIATTKFGETISLKLLKLFHQQANGSVQFLDRRHIAGLDRVHDAMTDVIPQNNLTDPVERGAHRRQLNQHLGTIAPVFHHSAYGGQMPDRAGQAVQNGFGLRVCMRVAMAVRLAAAQMFVTHIGLAPISNDMSITL